MFAISPTDIDWFRFLKTEGLNNEINFWTPTPWNISGLVPGDRLYFMLKSPIRKIGGYGQFLEYKNSTVNEAWNEFGLKNGCASKKEFIERLDKYKAKRSTDQTSAADSVIGCIVLTNAVLNDDDNFLDLNDFDLEFANQVVTIKYYTEDDPLSDFETTQELPASFVLLPTSSKKLRKARLVTERKGQGKFRAKLTTAYESKCCITGEDTPELLEAAHIQPYIDENSNHVKNGLLLRVDFHKIYDSGLMFIDDEYVIQISPYVDSDYYMAFNGKTISLPSTTNLHPSKEALMSKQFEYRNE
jgi:putative restriction endonuclease